MSLQLAISRRHPGRKGGRCKVQRGLGIGDGLAKLRWACQAAPGIISRSLSAYLRVLAGCTFFLPPLPLQEDISHWYSRRWYPQKHTAFAQDCSVMRSVKDAASRAASWQSTTLPLSTLVVCVFSSTPVMSVPTQRDWNDGRFGASTSPPCQAVPLSICWVML